jgi:LPXTG-site transpeptidase (sortase) family protein
MAGANLRQIASIAISLILLAQSFGAVSASNTLSATEYVSIQSDGLTLPTGSRAEYPSVSGDGRYVVFMSRSNDLVPGDSGNNCDIFLKDMSTGKIAILSHAADNTPANSSSYWPTITPDGRFVVFYSDASNLVSGDTNGATDVFIVDRGTDDNETNNSIERISQTPAGAEIKGYPSYIRKSAISDDGNYVVFATNAPGTIMTGITDTNRNDDVYLWERSTGTVKLISHVPTSDTTAANQSSTAPVISGDGKYIAYLSIATNLDANIGGAGLSDTNNAYDVFLYSVADNTSKLISLTTTNQIVATGSPSNLDISYDGDRIVWATNAMLDPVKDTNGTRGTDVYLYQRSTNSIVLASTYNYGSAGQHDVYNLASYFPSISADGRYLSFASYSVNLVPGKNLYSIGDVYIHDMNTGDNIRVSVAADGSEAESGSPYSISTDISADGQYVVYSSLSTGLVAGIDDTNNQYDVFRSRADWQAPTVNVTSLVKKYSLAGPTEIQLTFSEPMTARDSSSPYSVIKNVGAESTANYVLLEAGANGALDYSACGMEKSGLDDQFISIDSAVYDNATYTTTLTINGGVPLPLGQYRLLACGHTPYAPPALHDGVGNKMAADYVYDFTVTAPGSSPAETATASAGSLNVGGLLGIPLTGFAPGSVQALPHQTTSQFDSLTDWTLAIPSLGISSPIVGVPQQGDTWDVSWLGTAVGWLEGSAYPTWAGNTVLTGHVWDADNQPGIFVRLKELQYGDEIQIVTPEGTYVYAVRENLLVSPQNVGAVFEHEDLDWVTLVTCENFDSTSAAYLSRRVVKAVLLQVIPHQ